MDDEKMSSSLGNFITVDEALADYGLNAIRTFLLSGSYNSTQTYSEAAIEEAVKRAERLERTHERAVAALDGPDARTNVEDGRLRDAVDDTREAFTTAMNDDFNTRGALAALLELSTVVNSRLDTENEHDYQGLKRAVETFEEFGEGILGLSFAEGATGEVGIADELVELLLDVRESAREAGDYDRADELRTELEALGVEIQDTDDGPTYRLEAGE